jgi:hypothetical protein
MVCTVPAFALEYYLRGRENAPHNDAVTLRTGDVGLVCLEGHLFFEYFPAFGTGKIV